MKHDPRYLKLLGRLSRMQAGSFIVLLGVAMPVKYLAGHATGVTIMGALHGAVWLLYMWLLLAMKSLGMWSKAEMSRLVLSTLLPFGGFATARWIERMGR